MDTTGLMPRVDKKESISLSTFLAGSSLQQIAISIALLGECSMHNVNQVAIFHKIMTKRKASRTRTYPKASIDEGIKICLDNSKRLLQCAIDLNKQSNGDYAYIFYSFAVEEFGKAVMLKERKKSAADPIVDEITFKKHEEKITAALSELNNREVGIPIFKEIEPSGEILYENGEIIVKGELKFAPMEQIGEYLTVDNRLDLLFVDYNEKERRWQTWKDKRIPMWSSLSASMNAFNYAVQRWTKRHGFDT